jgi:predicted Ser/Thr protein kinase
VSLGRGSTRCRRSRLLELSDDAQSVRYEYVDGLPILDHLNRRHTSREEALDIFQQIFEQLLTLDELGVKKHEMTWPVRACVGGWEATPVLRPRPPVLPGYT